MCMKKLLFLALSLLISLPAVSAMTDLPYPRYNQLKEYVNALTNLMVIDFYQRQNPSPYAVLDKKTKTLYVLDEKAQRLATLTVRTYKGDELSKGGSGIYSFVGVKDGVYYASAERDNSVHGLFLTQEAPPVTKGMVLYVIPETTAHRFRIRNRQITFNSEDVIKNLKDFNYSPRNYTVYETHFSTDRNDRFSQRYVQALEREKARLMEIYKLENDEYNLLAEFAYGVLAPESDFGKSWTYRLKEIAPYAVSLRKGNGLDTSNNSRGPTQIKDIPELISKHYGIEKHELHDPEKAAIATLGKSAEFLIQIRNRADQHAGINEETLQNYMYYLYQGRRSEIINRTATPYFSIKGNLIREAIKGFHIEERF